MKVIWIVHGLCKLLFANALFVSELILFITQEYWMLTRPQPLSLSLQGQTLCPLTHSSIQAFQPFKARQYRKFICIHIYGSWWFLLQVKASLTLQKVSPISYITCIMYSSTVLLQNSSPTSRPKLMRRSSINKTAIVFRSMLQNNQTGITATAVILF